MSADETVPPRKRARTSDDVQPESQERDEDFWYEDGMIILIAANVKFCVYRGPLAKHSPIFRDMLSFPQPPKDTSSPSNSVSYPSLDCPVVRLTDSPNDLRHILTFGVSDPPFNKLSVWIHLGHKYQIDQLLGDGLAYLRSFYPNSLLTPRWQDAFDTTHCLVPKNRPMTISRTHAIGVVNLACLTESNDLLPLALLECCRLGVEITQGPKDLGRCFTAKGRLMQKGIEACLRIFAGAHVDYEAMYEECMCHNLTKCEKLLENYRCSSHFYVQFLSINSLLVEGQEQMYQSSELC
ncbi:hypothetical protein V8D89_012195 [Ganoderma adspersum]